MGRTHLNLNGLWDFVADLDPKYHSDAAAGQPPAYADPDADRRHWLKAPVPVTAISKPDSPLTSLTMP